MTGIILCVNIFHIREILGQLHCGHSAHPGISQGDFVIGQQTGLLNRPMVPHFICRKRRMIIPGCECRSHPGIRTSFAPNAHGISRCVSIQLSFGVGGCPCTYSGGAKSAI